MAVIDKIKDQLSLNNVDFFEITAKIGYCSNKLIFHVVNIVFSRLKVL